MSILEIIVRCSALAILCGYLLHKHRQRERAWHPEPQDPAQWNGKSMDLTPVMPSIEQLRQNYFVMPHSVFREAFRRQNRVALARQSLGRLSFFSDEKPKSEVEEVPPCRELNLSRTI